jgi:hydroxyacylglutathione hydrolase
MILHKFPFGPFDTNAILVGCAKTKKAAVIDPSYGSTPAILQQCIDLDLKIEKILITHSHWDHIADAYELKHKTSSPVFVHPLDAPNLKQPGSDGLPLYFPVHGVDDFQFVNDGDELMIGELPCRVIHSPGHSPGSVCYFLPNQKVLFTGDTLFEGSIGNLHLPTAQPKKMFESLRILTQLPPDTRIVPGHGRDTTLAQESWLSRAEEIFSEG